jgi:NAD+ kinase
MKKTPERVRSVAIVANPEKREALREVPKLSAWLTRQGVRVLSAKSLERVEAVITLGGDGTILAVAPRAARAGVPVLGINMGRLGFMTAVGLRDVHRGLTDWLGGRWSVSERLMLEVKAPRVKKPLLALNDAVVRLGSTTRVTAIQASIHNKVLGLFTGDGVIVSTTTGSTAYSMAAQGPIVHPDVEALILTPICPHSLSQRPVVFPATRTLELKVTDSRQGNEVQLCLDGQRVFALRSHDRIVVRASRQKLKLFQDPRMPYFEVLREKLLWGGR